MSKVYKFKCPADYITGYLRGGDILFEVKEEYLEEFKTAVEKGDMSVLRDFMEGFDNIDYRVEDWEIGNTDELEEIS